MSVLVDTNVLLRRTQPAHPSHLAAVESIARLVASDVPVYFTFQAISEFWNVATRPIEVNGMGLTIAATQNEIDKIEHFLTILPDTPSAYEEWKRLVITHEVKGVKVHDTKLVATMNVHGIRKILTFNTGDFARYDVEAVHPASLLA
jgi:predicted nucleic acid-binding protein